MGDELFGLSDGRSARRRPRHEQVLRNLPSMPAASSRDEVVACPFVAPTRGALDNLPAPKRTKLRDVIAPSALTERLTISIASGAGHVSEAQSTAAAARADIGNASAGIQGFSTLGGARNWVCNIERDYHRWAQHAWGLQVPIKFVPIPVQGGTLERPLIHPLDIVRVSWSAVLLDRVAAVAFKSFGRSRKTWSG